MAIALTTTVPTQVRVSVSVGHVQAGFATRSRAIAYRGLDTSLRLNKPELHVQIDRDRAADLGVSARDIGTALRLMVGGDEEVSRFHDPQTNEQYEVRLRIVEEDRNRPEIIDQLKLPSTSGGLVELGSVAAVERVDSASRIDLWTASA